MDKSNECIIIANLDRLSLLDYECKAFPTQKLKQQNFILCQTDENLNLRDLYGRKVYNEEVKSKQQIL